MTNICFKGPVVYKGYKSLIYVYIKKKDVCIQHIYSTD